MQVELVDYGGEGPTTGIGRYIHELSANLLALVPVRMVRPHTPRLSQRFPILRGFPLGVEDHLPGSVVHFAQVMGCSQMLWNPLHPAVATVHDLGMLVSPEDAEVIPLLNRIVLRLSYQGLRRMDAIIAISEYTRQTIIDRLHVSPDRVFTVISGNNGNQFRPIPDARAKLKALHNLPDHLNGRLLLYVGTEYPRKNLSTLIRALSLLPTNYFLLKVGAAGGSLFRDQTRALVGELHLERRVIFLDRVPEDQLPLIYSAADVFVTASLLEGFGQPILEAMACGTPVVCSNVTALPEIAGSAAVLVSPTDHQAFAHAITSVAEESSLRESLIARGFQRAREFSWAETAQATAGVYARLAGL